MANKLPNLRPRGKHHLYHTGHQITICSLYISSTTISIFQSCSLYKHFWKDSPEQKIVSVSAQKTFRNMKDPWRIASQQPEVRDIKETSHLYGRWWKDISLRVKRWKDFSSSWKTPSFCFLYFSFFLLKKKKTVLCCSSFRWFIYSYDLLLKKEPNIWKAFEYQYRFKGKDAWSGQLSLLCFLSHWGKKLSFLWAHHSRSPIPATVGRTRISGFPGLWV